VLAHLLQIRSRSGEELGGLLLIGRQAGSDVDDTFHPRKGCRETLAADDVHAV
jgi:hypothetical protein